jgi:hypothetical protein
MIRFPRMHIAESVANRILNLADDMRTGGFTPSPEPPTPPPELPHAPTMEGVGLDAQLAQPPPAELAVPPELAEPGA